MKNSKYCRGLQINITGVPTTGLTSRNRNVCICCRTLCQMEAYFSCCASGTAPQHVSTSWMWLRWSLHSFQIRVGEALSWARGICNISVREHICRKFEVMCGCITNTFTYTVAFILLLRMTHKTMLIMIKWTADIVAAFLLYIYDSGIFHIPRTTIDILVSALNQPVYASLSEDHGLFVRTGQNGENRNCGSNNWEGIFQTDATVRRVPKKPQVSLRWAWCGGETRRGAFFIFVHTNQLTWMKI